MNLIAVIGGIALGAISGAAIGGALSLGPTTGVDSTSQNSGLGPTQYDTKGNEVVTSNFPTNALGQTYGSSALAQNDSEIPDLVSVWVDETTIGYVPKSHFLPPKPDDPTSLEDPGRRGDGFVLAYASDGKTELGWVSIEGTSLPPHASPAPPK